MRINVFVASATGMSRRAADREIIAGNVKINSQTAQPGDQVSSWDNIELNGQIIYLPTDKKTIILNKPVGYVSSRAGQGSQTIYDLLPPEFHSLKPVGRLDKDSSGLLLLTNDGKLAHSLSHPSFNKEKVYEVMIDKKLSPKDQQKIKSGIALEDGLSKLALSTNYKLPTKNWTVLMSEGRNRQIRRTFAALGYDVIELHRIKFGDYKIGSLTEGKYLIIS